MSTPTDDDSGFDLLLFVALQVSTEWTSSRSKFCTAISLRVTPFRTVVVRLFTNLSLRYQDTVGAGLPAENTRQSRCGLLRAWQKSLRRCTALTGRPDTLERCWPPEIPLRGALRYRSSFGHGQQRRCYSTFR